MKSNSTTNHSGRRFPLVEYHYQTAALENLSGSCVTTPKVSHRIGGDYFDVEANRDFLGDVLVFGTLIVTTAVPILTTASAVLELCRTLPLF